MNTLKLGSTGPDVELLQATLIRAGFDPGEINGVFGVATQCALTAYQEFAGITADGIAGSDTWCTLMPFISGYVLHHIAPGDTYYLLAQKYASSVEAIETANPNAEADNLQIGDTLVIPLDFPVVFTNISFTSTVLTLCIDGLKARYPFLRVSNAGSSVLGKPLYTLEVGNGENSLFVNSAHHANEWITTPVILKFLEEYCEGFAFGLELNGFSPAELYDCCTLYMVPMVNPDGVDLVTGSIAPGSTIYEEACAMNTDSLPFPDAWKANIAGVDLNLQYPAGWEIAREIKFSQGYTQPGPINFVGDAPLEQPESRAMYEYTLDNDFNITLSYHTQGEVIYWRYLEFSPPGAYQLGQQLSSASGYLLESTPYESGFAGYKDWFILTTNRPGYTIEAGLGENPLPISQFDQIYADNFGLLLAALHFYC